jgi:hypothetical protein
MPRPSAVDAAEPVVISADIGLFARTLWGEAAGESVRGIEALAAVVMTARHCRQDDRSMMPAGAFPAGVLKIRTVPGCSA